jgi:hypothetical protein
MAAPSITNLANYFVTADGRDLLLVLGKVIELAGSRQVDFISLGPAPTSCDIAARFARAAPATLAACGRPMTR